MGIELLNPHVRHARRHVSRFVVRRGTSRCYDARLFYFENTEGTLTVEGVKYKVSNKIAVFLPPLTRYKISIEVNDTTAVTVFNFDLTKEATHIISSLGTPTVSEFDESLAPVRTTVEGLDAPIIKKTSRISSHISAALSNFADGKGAYLERASANLKLAILELYDDGVKEYTPLCKSILAYVNEHLSDTNLTNYDIAAHFNYHPYYVNRIIKREVGVPLRSYIIDQRLDAAREGDRKSVG